jgi:hypothetical protein
LHRGGADCGHDGVPGNLPGTRHVTALPSLYGPANSRTTIPRCTHPVRTPRILRTHRPWNKKNNPKPCPPTCRQPILRCAGAATTVGVATAERADIPIVSWRRWAPSPRRPPCGCGRRSRACCKKCCSRKARWSRSRRLLATIDPRQFEMALMQASGQRQRDEAQLAARASRCSASRRCWSRTPSPARTSTPRSRAGQAARRHGRHRQGQRRHGAAQPRLHPRGRARRAAASACAPSTSAMW